jgi:hypothetical protein
MPADPPHTPDEAHAADAATPADGQGKSLVVGLLIIALLLALILVQVRPDLLPNSPAESATQDLQAAIDAERAELNRELVALNLPPLKQPASNSSSAVSLGQSQSEVAKRIAADANTLASNAANVQRLLDAKDAEIAAVTNEVLQAQKELLAASKQLNVLQQQVHSSLPTAESEILQRGAEIAAARTAALGKSLAEANARLADYANTPSAAEHASLQSLYQDALRARDFFENRASELEKKLSAQAPAPPAESLPETDPGLPQL